MKTTLTLLMLLGVVALSCDENQGKVPIDCAYAFNASDIFKYPVQPGTDAWEAFEDIEEIKDALQIPNAVLNDISDEGLVETCFNHPLVSSLLVYNNLLHGYKFIFDDFNGMQKLNQKPESAALLLARYKRMYPSCFLDGGFTDLIFTDITVSQPVFLNRLTTTEKKQLMELALGKYVTMSNNSFLDSNLQTVTYLMARIMVEDNYDAFLEAVNADEKLLTYTQQITKGNHFEQINKILNHAKEYQID
ncbi:hypothetical protein [Gelatiniphilus marinus]|uniref:DUF4375 domain-containing protein n=1 Tax=Gelatiniphilus marinus TaxID=1759464 RepID=A0ABW5JVB7_9FLAO